MIITTLLRASDHWQLWAPENNRYPPWSYCIVSLDCAATLKKESGYSALTIWAVFQELETNMPAVMLADAWAKRLALHGEEAKRLADAYHPKSIWRRLMAWWRQFVGRSREIVAGVSSDITQRASRTSMESHRSCLDFGRGQQARHQTRTPA